MFKRSSCLEDQVEILCTSFFVSESSLITKMFANPLFLKGEVRLKSATSKSRFCWVT